MRFDYLPDETAAVETALAAMTRGPAADAVDVVLTAGGRSTDPSDPFFVALEGVGGRLIRRGVPAHPGSMLWLGRVGKAAVLGLPTCGAYSKATAADLLLPRLLTGEPPSLRTVSRLGHGGILTRDMRFRFPAYARDAGRPRRLIAVRDDVGGTGSEDAGAHEGRLRVTGWRFSDRGWFHNEGLNLRAEANRRLIADELVERNILFGAHRWFAGGGSPTPRRDHHDRSVG